MQFKNNRYNSHKKHVYMMAAMATLYELGLFLPKTYFEECVVYIN